MGAINYKTIEYITMGVDIPAIEKSAEAYRKEYQENAAENGYILTDYEAEEEIKENDINSLYEAAAEVLKKYDFYNFKVEIEPGYYEGFFIDFRTWFDCTLYEEEREEIKAEIQEVKKMLIDFKNIGLRACCPSWCTGYYTEEETTGKIEEAIKGIEKELATIPTCKND